MSQMRALGCHVLLKITEHANGACRRSMPTEHADGPVASSAAPSHTSRRETSTRSDLTDAYLPARTSPMPTYLLGPPRCLPTCSDLTDAYLPARTSPMPTYLLGPRRCPLGLCQTCRPFAIAHGSKSFVREK